LLFFVVVILYYNVPYYILPYTIGFIGLLLFAFAAVFVCAEFFECAPVFLGFVKHRLDIEGHLQLTVWLPV